MSGKLIVIEGSDSSGKATQAELLLKRLQRHNIPAEKADFPQYGTWSAAFVERYLNGEFGSSGEVSAQQASLFYALDRFAAKKRILQWLKEGKAVVANRYVGSNQAYQGAKIQTEDERKKFLAWLDELEHGVLGLPRPDLVLYLRVPLEVSRQLLERRRKKDYISDGTKDLHERDEALLRATEEVYEHLAQREERWRVIDCTEEGVLLPKEKIHEKVWKEAEKLLD